MENIFETITNFIMSFINAIKDLVAKIRKSNDEK